jgi:hypothetical protein
MWAPRLVFVQIEKKQILRCAQDDSLYFKSQQEFTSRLGLRFFVAALLRMTAVLGVSGVSWEMKPVCVKRTPDPSLRSG